MSRRITVRVRGLPVDVVYADRGDGDVGWYFASVNWRMIDYDRMSDLTRGEILAIDAACLADLRKRRAAWCRRLANRTDRTGNRISGLPSGFPESTNGR